MGKDKLSYTAERIREKKRAARQMIGLPMSKDIKPTEQFKWAKKRELYTEICEQIIICEQLMRPLSMEDLQKLCKLETVYQIDSYCRKVKHA